MSAADIPAAVPVEALLAQEHGAGELAPAHEEPEQAATPMSNRFTCAPDGAMGKADAPAPVLAEAMLACEGGAALYRDPLSPEGLAPAHEEPEQAAFPASNRFACAPDGAMSKADAPAPVLAGALLACEGAAHEEAEQEATPASKRFPCAPGGAISKAGAPAPVLAGALLAHEHGAALYRDPLSPELLAATHEEAKKEAPPASKRFACAPDGAMSKADGPSPSLAEALLAHEHGANELAAATHGEAEQAASPMTPRFPCATDGATRKADGPSPALAEAMLAQKHGARELAAPAHEEPEQEASPASNRFPCAPDGEMSKADGPSPALAEAMLAQEHGTNELAAATHGEAEQAASPMTPRFPCATDGAMGKADGPAPALAEALLAHEHGAGELAAATHEEAEQAAIPVTTHFPCAPDGAMGKAGAPAPVLAEALLAHEHGADELLAAHEEAGKEASPMSKRIPCAPGSAMGKADAPAPVLAEAFLPHEHGAGELAATHEEPEQEATPMHTRFPCASGGAPRTAQPAPPTPPPLCQWKPTCPKSTARGSWPRHMKNPNRRQPP